MLTDHENMLANINREVDRLGLKHEIIAIAVDIPLATFERKLQGTSDFTVSEIVKLSRVLKFNPSSVFKPQPARFETRPCTDPACTDTEHQWTDTGQDGPCTLTQASHPGGAYIVSGSKYHGEQWEAWVDLSGDPEVPAGEAGLWLLEQLVTEYRAMMDRCEILNRPGTLHRSTEPGEPDLGGIGGGL